MGETNGTTQTTADVPELQEMKEAYEAFLYIWNKVPRSLRPERDNQQRMSLLRGFFERQIAMLETKRRAQIAGALLGAVASPDGLAPHTEDAASDAATTRPIHVALQVNRLLTRKQWEMVKSFVDLHKFAAEDVAELMAELRDTHCADCGTWLEDDDDHADCPMRAEAADAEDAPAETPPGEEVAAADADAPAENRALIESVGAPSVLT